MGKNKIQAHHTSAYFHTYTRRVSSFNSNVFAIQRQLEYPSALVVATTRASHISVCCCRLNGPKVVEDTTGFLYRAAAAVFNLGT